MTVKLPGSYLSNMATNPSVQTLGPSYTFSTKVITAGALISESSYGGAQSTIAAAFIAVTAANAVLPQLPLPQSQWISVERKSSSRRKFSDNQSVNSDLSELAMMKQQYSKLDYAVQTLSALPEHDTHYLDKDVSEESRQFLQFLKEINVFPPKIFPHGGDTLVFEWETFDGIRYVTYESEVARIRDDRDNAEFRQAAELDVKKEEDLSRLVQALGGQQWRVKHQNSAI